MRHNNIEKQTYKRHVTQHRFGMWLYYKYT